MSRSDGQLRKWRGCRCVGWFGCTREIELGSVNIYSWCLMLYNNLHTLDSSTGKLSPNPRRMSLRATTWKWSFALRFRWMNIGYISTSLAMLWVFLKKKKTRKSVSGLIIHQLVSLGSRSPVRYRALDDRAHFHKRWENVCCWHTSLFYITYLRNLSLISFSSSFHCLLFCFNVYVWVHYCT